MTSFLSDPFGFRRRREARERAERAKELARREQNYVAAENRRRARAAAGMVDSGYTPPSPLMDPLSPLNPASPLSIYSHSVPSYDTGPSHCHSSDSGSSSYSSSSDSGSSCSSSDSGSSGGGGD